MTKEYVLGFVVTDKWNYTLIKKTKPEWQAGLLNGVGGKIEEGETPIEAMSREFHEETGQLIETNHWHQYCTMTRDGDFIVHVYFSMWGDESQIKTTTEEEVVLMPYDDIVNNPDKCISNIPWLVSMIMDKDCLRNPLRVEYQ